MARAHVRFDLFPQAAEWKAQSGHRVEVMTAIHTLYLYAVMLVFLESFLSFIA